MIFQLTISHSQMTAADALIRKKVISLETPDCSIGPADAMIPLEGYAGSPITISEPAKNKIIAEGPFGKRELHSGDTLKIDVWNVQFHRTFPKANLSWRASLLARGTQGLIIILALIFTFMVFFLPDFLRRSSIWSNSTEQFKLHTKIDDLRQKIKDISETCQLDTINTSLLDSISKEIEKRTRYLRTYAPELSLQQQEKLFDDLKQFDQWIERIANNYRFAPMPKPKIDEAVKKILPPDTY